MGALVGILLLLYAAGGASAQMNLEPVNALVLRGMDAKFNCSWSQTWTVMSWILNGSVVLTISEKYGILNNSKRFTARNHSSAQAYKWEFIILDVWLNDSGLVTCDLQNLQKKEAFLSIQEKGTVAIVNGNETVNMGQWMDFQCRALGWFPQPHVSWALDGEVVDPDLYNTSSVDSGGLFDSVSTLSFLADHSITVQCLAGVPAMPVPETSSVFLSVVTRDQTVLIAVTVSIAAVVLLVLLIIGIVFCCKGRRGTKSGYEEEMRKKAGTGKGKDNFGFSTDGHRGFGHSQFGDRQPDANQMPYVISNQAANSPGNHYTLHSPGVNFKKQRHATIV